MVKRSADPSPRARPTTLADVARLAGVSVATASKALNGRVHVRAETRHRVLEAAEQLSFLPNTLARGLLAGRTGTVGLLTSDLEGRFSIPILMGAEDAFGAGKVNVIICDNVGAGRLAVEHLIACGRTRIAHISGDPRYAAARDRAEGVLAGLADAGLSQVGDVRYSSWSEAWGRSAAAMLLDRHPDVDAVFCGSDQVARGVMDMVRERGRRIPDDVAVMGFDNWEVLAADARPPLTSVDMNLEEVGRAAARAVFAALDGAPRRGLEVLPCRVVIRGSTAPLS